MARADDDKQTVRRAAAGDDRAYGELVERYAPQIFALVHRITGRREDAEDIAQEVFVKAWSSLHKFDGRASFRTWLWRIACNTALSALRARKVVREQAVDDRLWNVISDSDVDDFFAAGADDARVAALAEAIGMLEPEEKAFVHLFYFEQKPITECAVMLGLTEGNAKVKLHRIRKKLYALIKNRER